MSATHRDRRLSDNAHDFIDDAVLAAYWIVRSTRGRCAILSPRAWPSNRLEVAETAVLLNATQPELVESIFEAARQLKRDVYGNRIVLFAPLYIGNECINDCDYCGFRRSNRDAIRRTLDRRGDWPRRSRPWSVSGHKRLILVFGEHPRTTSPEFIAEACARCTRCTTGTARSGA